MPRLNVLALEGFLVVTALARSSLGDGHIELIDSKRNVLGNQFSLQIPRGASVSHSGREKSVISLTRGGATFSIEISETFATSENLLRDSKREIARTALFRRPNFDTFSSGATKLVAATGVDSTNKYVVYAKAPNGTVKQFRFVVSPPGDQSYAWNELSYKIARTIVAGSKTLATEPVTGYLGPLDDRMMIKLPRGVAFEPRVGVDMAYHLELFRNLGRPQSACEIAMNSDPVPLSIRKKAARRSTVRLASFPIEWNVVSMGTKALYGMFELSADVQVYMYCRSDDFGNLMQLKRIIETIEATTSDSALPPFSP